jgi:membrane fusion protein (multidrug efflux system)
MRKRFIIVGMILVLVFGGLIAYHFVMNYFIAQYMKNFAPGAVTVNTLKVEPVDWQPVYSTVGSAVAVQGTDVSPIVSGMVTQVLFKSGDLVKKGQPLVVLDTDVLQASLDNAKAALTFNQLTYQRYQTLYRQGVIAEQDLDQAKSTYAQSLATVAQDTATLNQKYITAPFSGRVGIRQVSLGQYLNAGTVVTNIQNLNPIYVNFQVPEQFLTQLHLNAPVNVSIDTFKDHIFKGKITAFDAEVADDTKSITVQATFTNTDKSALILPGMQANIDVLLPQKGKVIAIPQQAVAYSLYGNTVYVVSEDSKPDVKADKKVPTSPNLIAKQVNVTLGASEGNLIEVVSGLKPGDIVVVDGQVKLQNGSSVSIASQSSAS